MDIWYNLITNPQWIIAILTFLAIVVALFKEEILNLKNRPKIRFGLSNKEPHIIQIYGGGDMISKYFRIKVINQGKTVAKNCQVKLISLTPKNKNSIPSIIEQDKLKWSNAPLDRRYCHEQSVSNLSQLIPVHRERIDLSPGGGWELCDLFVITSGNRLMFLSSGERIAHLKNEDYIVSIEISGENLKPKKAKLRISNPNSFEHIRIDWV